MKRVLVTQEKELFERRIREEENEYFRKRQVRDNIENSKKQFKNMKAESQSLIGEQTRDGYHAKIMDRNAKVSKVNEKINQLEEVEKLLVEKLSMTQMN